MPLKFTVTRDGGAQLRTCLPIASSEGFDGDLVSTEDGQPVWPIRTRQDAEALGSLATVFAGELHWVKPVVPAQLPEVHGTVVGIGDVEQETLLYAHLTNRSSAIIGAVSDLSAILPEVILIGSRRLSRELVQMLSLASYDQQAPGIIWGRSPRELRRQVLTCSAAAILNGPLAHKARDIHSRDRSLGAGLKGVSELREILDKGYGTLTIFSHSDGMGQRLGPTALCTRAAIDPETNASHGPECTVTGVCHRAEKDANEALSSHWLIGPEEIAARILIDTGCFMAYVGGGAVDSAWSLLPRLAVNPRIGALVVNPELNWELPEVMRNEFAKFVGAGLTVGQSLVRFEENPNIRSVGCRMLIFGDPRTRAGSSAQPTLVARLQESPREHTQSSHLRHGLKEGTEDPELVMLRCLAGFICPESRDRARATSEELRDSLREVQESGTYSATAIRRIQIATFRHLATSKVRLYEAWQAAAVIQQEPSIQRCLHCNWIAHPRSVKLPGGEVRYFFACPTCSDALDVPGNTAVRISMPLPIVRLDAAAKSIPVSAAIYAVRASPRDTIMYPWPTNQKGELAEEVDIRRLDVPPGPVRICAVLMSGLSVHSFGRPMRADALMP